MAQCKYMQCFSNTEFHTEVSQTLGKAICILHIMIFSILFVTAMFPIVVNVNTGIQSDIRFESFSIHILYEGIHFSEYLVWCN